MSTSAKLTVICVFSEPDLIETTLTSVYDLKETALELIIINDGAGADATSIIQSITAFYDHDETYFFEHDLRAGVGIRVNEVLATCTGSVLWVVNSLGRVDESELHDALDALSHSDAVVATVFSEIPGALHDWVQKLTNATEQERLGFLWKWEAVPSNQRYFDPYLLDSVSLELIWRLENAPFISRPQAWFIPAVEEQRVETWALKRELALHWLRNYHLDSDTKTYLVQLLTETDTEAFEQARSEAESLLDKAREEYAKKNFVRALNYAREAYHQEEENEVIRDYYVQLLEYLGRHIEADEIKGVYVAPESDDEVEIEENEFEIRTQLADFSEIIDEGKAVKINQPEPPKPIEPEEVTANYDENATVMYSVVIPTTGYGLSLLEECFESLLAVMDRSITEVIVVDNSSLDETYAYLDELVKNKVFRLEVITNRQNKGFAASVNQGIEKASGEFVLVLHNDCKINSDVFYELSQVFDLYDDAGAVVPMLSASLVDQQDREHTEFSSSSGIVELPHCDSACIMVKKSSPFRFDEVFGLAYYEDIDFCHQLSNAGKKVYLHTQIEIEHRYGGTTSLMGISPDSDYYALNMSKFNKKWGFEPAYDSKYNQLRELDRCLMISSMMNPVDPELHLFEEFKNNFTDEVKTEIVKTTWDAEYAIAIASMLIKTDQREILRKIEAQLDTFTLPIRLVQDLVHYYFDRTIFSRCIHYLTQYGNDPEFTNAALYQLKIYLGDRQLEEAAALLGSLFEVYPANPELYKLTADFHLFQNNKEEAEQFLDIASQIDPFRFGKPKGSVSSWV